MLETVVEAAVDLENGAPAVSASAAPPDAHAR